MDETFSIIANPKTDEAALVRAIQKLGPVTEPSRFWTDIANSEAYSKSHRRWAVFQLFRRHVSPNIPLSELARILDNPTWLTDQDIHIVDALGGKIPVQFTLEDTIFVLTIFPDLPDGRYENWAIYLRVSGKVDPHSFFNLLHGDNAVSAAVKEAKLLEFALVPNDPTKVNRQ